MMNKQTDYAEQCPDSMEHRCIHIVGIGQYYMSDASKRTEKCH